jgi:plastocyanin
MPQRSERKEGKASEQRPTGPPVRLAAATSHGSEKGDGMESRRVHLKRRLATVAGLAALLLLVPAAGSSAASATSQVQMLDDCDPATFNAAIGPGTCVKDGSTTFSEFIAQLLAQGRAPAWRFAPEQLRLDAGGTLQAHNRGGEVHTFTEVATFGGGCIQALNDLLGLTPVPECAGFPGGVFGATAVPPGGTVTTAPLSPGVHRYECLIHPWMQTTATVG